MILFLAIPVFIAVTLAVRLLQVVAPSNMLVNYVRRTRPSAGRAVALAAVAVAVLLAGHWLTFEIARGAPGWLNLIVLVLLWDAIKIGLLAVSVGARAAFMPFRRGARTPHGAS